jgi:hypothetical protein
MSYMQLGRDGGSPGSGEPYDRADHGARCKVQVLRLPTPHRASYDLSCLQIVAETVAKLPGISWRVSWCLSSSSYGYYLRCEHSLHNSFSED